MTDPLLPWLRRVGLRPLPGSRHRFRWGEFYWKPGLALEYSVDAQGCLLIVKPLICSAYIHLTASSFLDLCGEDRSYGFGIHKAHGLHLRWGRCYKCFEWPWAWEHSCLEYLDQNGRVVREVKDAPWWRRRLPRWLRRKLTSRRLPADMERWFEDEVKRLTSCCYCYRYCLRNGEIQECTATISLQRRTWHRRWLPFCKSVVASIDVRFDAEMGEQAGSWKGGVLGCGYDLRTGETPKACLRRMERERKFE